MAFVGPIAFVAVATRDIATKAAEDTAENRRKVIYIMLSSRGQSLNGRSK
jgi:hypothetical protein